MVRNPIWSSLILFGQIWSKKIKNKAVIFILSVNVTTFYCNIFRLVRNPIWSSLIKFDPFWTDLIQKIQKQNSHFYPFCKCDNFSQQAHAPPPSEASVGAALCLKTRLFYHINSWMAILRQHKVVSCTWQISTGIGDKNLTY